MPGSRDLEPSSTPDRESDVTRPGSPSLAAAEEPQPETAPAATGPDNDDTVGTGTSIALGCIAGTLLLVVIGLIFLGILYILG